MNEYNKKIYDEYVMNKPCKPPLEFDRHSVSYLLASYA